VGFEFETEKYLVRGGKKFSGIREFGGEYWKDKKNENGEKLISSTNKT